MNYEIIKLFNKNGTPHGSYRYSHLYSYLIKFSVYKRLHARSAQFMQASSVTVCDWAQALQWCNNTWGWSADAVTTETVQSLIWENLFSTDIDDRETRVINPHWTYSNSTLDRLRTKDLRIYLKSGKELMLFKLAHPVDQKS